MGRAALRLKLTLHDSACRYTGIEAPPSLLPAKKYCDLTGLEAKYTDPKSKLRYFSATEYAQVRLARHVLWFAVWDSGIFSRFASEKENERLKLVHWLT